MTQISKTDDMLLAIRWDIAKTLRNVLGIHEETEAEQVAEQIIETLQLRYGGSEVYIPAMASERRHAMIKAASNGRNRTAVCQELNISKATYYRALKKNKNQKHQ